MQLTLTQLRIMQVIARYMGNAFKHDPKREYRWKIPHCYACLPSVLCKGTRDITAADQLCEQGYLAMIDDSWGDAKLYVATRMGENLATDLVLNPRTTGENYG